jgi:hypothetical protein
MPNNVNVRSKIPKLNSKTKDGEEIDLDQDKVHDDEA